MNDQECKLSILKHLEKEMDENPNAVVKRWWLSFVDPNKPEGSRFLGVVICENPYLTLAINETHTSKCNPGGELSCIELPTDFDLKGAELWRLYSKEDLKNFGLI